MRAFAVALVAGVAGCASAAQPSAVTRSAGEGGSAFDEVRVPAAAPRRSDAEIAIAAIPTGTTALPRYAAIGADDGPEVRVTAPRETHDGPTLHEERLVGSNEQPEWTTERTFATVRAYVIQPGQIEVEQWYKLQNPRGSAPNHLWQTEVAMGFEGGWQADVYVNYGREPDGPTQYQAMQYEVRKALAKWGEIPLNPTLYAEYVENYRAADKVELKLLLAEELCPGWHWAANLFYEQVTGADRATETGASMGIMRTLIDSKFGAGFEAKYEHVAGSGYRSFHDAENELLVGPSFQWRPTENMHVDIAPLFGFSKSDQRDPRTEIYIVVGYDFGPDRDGRRAPVSTGAR